MALTAKQLDEKYSEDQGEMSPERERELVNDLFDYYEAEGFAKGYWNSSADPYLEGFNGRKFSVVRRITEEETDLENLPLWEIQFGSDEETVDADPTEIIPSEMRSSGSCPDLFWENGDNFQKALSEFVQFETDTSIIYPWACTPEEIMKNAGHIETIAECNTDTETLYNAICEVCGINPIREPSIAPHRVELPDSLAELLLERAHAAGTSLSDYCIRILSSYQERTC